MGIPKGGGEGGGEVLVPSFGIDCETDPKISGVDSRDRRAVTPHTFIF